MTVRAPHPGPASARPGSGIAWLGDSITRGATGSDADGGFNLGDAFPVAAGLVSGQKLFATGYYGAPGEKIQQFIARVPQALARKPRILFTLGGTNDTTDVSPDSLILSNFVQGATTIAKMAETQGVLPAFGTIPPNNGRSRQIVICNTWLKRFCRVNGYPLVDFYAVLVASGITGYDQGGSAQQYQSGYTLDGTHPSPIAIGIMANLLNDVLGPYMPPWVSPEVRHKTIDGSAFLLNPLWASQSANPGIFPDSCTAYGAQISNAQGVTYSTALTGPGYGYSLKMTHSSSTNSAGVAMQSASQAQAGDRLLLTGRFSTDGKLAIQAQLYFVNGGLTYKPMSVSAGMAVANGLYYMEMAAPSTGLVGVQLIYGGTGTGSATFGYPTLINLSQAGGLN